MRLVRIATCNLNQWAMDFDTNLANIVESIRQAKALGCRFRTGPELEVSGYGCEDHFLETDLFEHCWESIVELLSSDITDDILVDVGMPILHQGVRFNCRVFMLNRKILFIRPKVVLASDGNYREERWFTAWVRRTEIDEFQLPLAVRELTGQLHVPFGLAILRLRDTTLASETCEELFTPDSPNIPLGLNGAEIISNGSGSHHNFRKLNQRINLIQNAMARGGGVYTYANQQGCDGGRLYYDGCACVCVNGELVAQGSQFSLLDVEMVAATVDLDEVVSYRGSIASRGVQAAAASRIALIDVDFSLSGNLQPMRTLVSRPLPRLRVHSVEEEIALGPACWLWDYLRRSGAGGYFLPLSGGADSAATAALVGSMCNLVAEAARAGNAAVIADARRIARLPEDSDYLPEDPKEFCGRIMHTCYMGTVNSSAETRARAKALAGEIGSYHWDVNIDTMGLLGCLHLLRTVDATVNLFEAISGQRPKFSSRGGTPVENLALQNIQARLRMVLSYLCAQLLPWVRKQGGGFLLVLGSGNVDEALRGYLTKYDCSSADLNPIGGISKEDLKRFLLWSADHLGYRSLADIVEAPPSAELVPPENGRIQSDEEEMGMSYAELGVFGRLRKVARNGPVAMYENLRSRWGAERGLSPTQVAEKVKRFFFFYSVNRHKVTTLTPSYHAEAYSPEDNRYDLRQFLYNVRWPRQFRAIDRMVEQDTLAAEAPANEVASAALPEPEVAGKSFL